MEVKGQLMNSTSYSSSEALQRDVCPRIRLERVQELLEKQRSLQQVLSLRLKELRRVCLQEAELTGKLPPEYPLEPGERPQPVRRRPAIACRISTALMNEEAPSLEELTCELALQQQMAEAARRLAIAPDLTAEQRRRRKQVQTDAAQRLRELEVQVLECRLRLGKGPLQRGGHEEAFHSESSSLSESASHENDDPHSFHPSKVSNHQGTFSERPSPPKARDHLRAISSSPDRRPGWRLLQPDLYSDTKDRRNSVASPTSPNRTLPRSVSSFEGRSVPATPVLARNACSGSHQFRSEAPGLQPRQWSGSHDSQLGPPSRDTSADRASLFAARTRRSNSSEALIERAPSDEAPLPSGPPFKSAEALTPSLSGRSPRPPYSDLLLDYYLERRCWGRGEHLSRRDGLPQPEWGPFPESPQQRRARPAARTKSCGPLLPPQPREVGYGPPLPPHRNFHKALALEGLRDWYLRNAGVSQRAAPERRGALLSVHQQMRSYYEPVPSNPEMGYYGGPGGLPHSVSYAGQPLYGRYGARLHPLPR
ncbi:coiled-coil domain-containing protein 120 isoform X2 [Varanus komodoensis]|uniref:coiled-coil domain-containing protein 120 isoform X2 n=1 Tax=Varanus komodoensis TaxID=61221 RepID=UPI001CF7B502|nr:coiled-coil domain-containing protein 120 isoform X2 [Varanus komodoensis]